MTTSLHTDIMTKLFGIQGYELKGIGEHKHGTVLELERTAPLSCPRCGASVAAYDSNEQVILLATMLCRAIYGRISVYRITCPQCGVLTADNLISKGKRRYSEKLGEQVVHYTAVLDNRATARLLGLSESSVYRIDVEQLSELEKTYLESIPESTQLGVDEVSYKRKHKYASVIINQEDGKVLWLEKGRKKEDLERGYGILGESIEGVQSVSLDFWQAYESATRECLPESKIVYDRFHLARLINRAVEQERRKYQRELIGDERKMIKKHARWVLLKRETNLTLNNKEHLQELKQQNEPLYELYLLKEDFMNIFEKDKDPETAQAEILQWGETVFSSQFEFLKGFFKSVLKRLISITSWFECQISNGKSEGVNNVIKTILKRAYGYKNFQYFRLKVLQKCGYLMNYATHSF